MLTVAEIRARAQRFADEWDGETREDAERQTFWNQWFDVFGLNRRRLGVVFERNVKKLNGNIGQIDAFLPGKLLVEHKSAGADLDAAMDQATSYLTGVAEEEWPRLIVLCDFARFRLLDTESGEEIEFPLEELPKQVERFTFLAGYRPRAFKDQDEVNVRAAALMGEIYSELAASGYDEADLDLLLVRLVFALFADDTALWGETGLFENYLIEKTREDGTDLGMHLATLFELLDTPAEKRQAGLPEALASFPYVNGDLFSASLPTPAFTAQARATLLKACSFDWSKISPAIFGSMFQSVMDPAARHSLGAHYTTERNIMKTIGPLFVDELDERLEKAGRDKAKLKALFAELREMRFLDPACGSGNFLVISYRELRRVELEILRRLQALDPKVKPGQMSADVALLSHVRVDQFYGIEIEEFPARIAELAMYLMDHLCNMELAREFGLVYPSIPLGRSVNIHVGNALTTDWNAVIPASDCSYVLGNPPFVATARRSREQSVTLAQVFDGTTVVDYVGAWFVLAARYARNTTTRVALVATNSIVQGEQVPALWPLVFENGMEIDFAHRTFRWSSDAPGRAAVNVVIIGFSSGGQRPAKLIFDYDTPRTNEPQVREAGRIGVYLTEADSDVIPRRRRTPLLGAPKMSKGSQPTDGGHLLVSQDEYEAVCADPIARKYLRPLIGAEGLLNGSKRWCLWLDGADPAELRTSKVLAERIALVRAFRLKSRKAATRQAAETPSRFDEIRQPQSRYLCVPRHTSENRSWVPMALTEPEVIAHDSTMTIEGCDVYLFGILHSSMWMAWLRAIGGRLKSDYRISAQMVYNTFPWPNEPSATARKKVEDAAQAVLDARDAHPGNTLADLYDPNAMPADLLKAHQQLDKAVDALYGRGSFDENKRLAVLLARYEKLIQTLPA